MVVLLVHFPAQAQEPEEPGARIQRLDERLHLSEDQREQIRPIIEQEAKNVKEIRSKYEGETSRRSRLKMFGELRGVQQDAIKRIDPLLSKEQRVEWEKIRMERLDARQDARRDKFKRRR